MQAAAAERYLRVEVPFALSAGKFEEVKDLDMERWGAGSLEVKYHTPEEEIAFVYCTSWYPPLANLLLFIPVWVQPVGCGTI